MKWAGIAMCAAFLPAHAFAFRLLSDAPDSAVRAPVRWNSSEIPFSIRAAESVPIENLESILLEAVDTWSEAPCSVKFRYDGVTLRSAQSGDGIVTIEFVEDWSARGLEPGIPATTEVQTLEDAASANIADADILLNAQEFDWQSGTHDLSGLLNTLAIEPVVQHEMGHALGILHPCELGGEGGAPHCDRNRAFEQSVMFPFYQPYWDGELGADDVAAACYLYPFGEERTEHAAPNAIPIVAADTGGCEVSHQSASTLSSSVFGIATALCFCLRRKS